MFGWKLEAKLPATALAALVALVRSWCFDNGQGLKMQNMSMRSMSKNDQSHFGHHVLSFFETIWNRLKLWFKTWIQKNRSNDWKETSLELLFVLSFLSAQVVDRCRCSKTSQTSQTSQITCRGVEASKPSGCGFMVCWHVKFPLEFDKQTVFPMASNH